MRPFHALLGTSSLLLAACGSSDSGAGAGTAQTSAGGSMSASGMSGTSGQGGGGAVGKGGSGGSGVSGSSGKGGSVAGQAGAAGVSGTSPGLGGSSSKGGSSTSVGGNGVGGSGDAAGKGGSTGGAGPGGSGTGGTSPGGTGGAGGSDTMPISPLVPIEAMHRLYLGDTTIDDVSTADAWKAFGFDIDGQVDTPSTANHCMPKSGAKKADVFINGNAGIDNSWGYNIIPIMQGLSSDFSTKTDDQIDAGIFSLGLLATPLPPGGGGTGILAQLVSITGAGVSPTQAQWNDGSFAWQATSVEVVQTSPFLAKAQFPGSAMAMYVLTPASHATVHLAFDSKYGFILAIHEARFTATYANDEKHATLMLGGVLDTEEFLAMYKSYAGHIAPSLCSGGALAGIMQQIRQASDIMANGTQDPTQVCNGISIGLAAKMAAATIGAVYTAPTSPSPCP